MKRIACTISYGKTEIDYELLMMNRKSLEIAVHPDKSVVVKAPETSTLEAIEKKIKKRARWIKRQITYFNQFDPRTPDRKYVGGESHLYLGRKYRLKIEASDKDKVVLKNGYFCIETTSNQPDHIKQLMEVWYRRRAKMYLSKIFDACWEDFKKGNLSKPNLKLQKMDKRWGSLSGKGQLTLNVKLIQTSKECIEYVVIHELCHLTHHNHGTEFYKLLDSTMPDWMKRKHRLEMTLI
jgi:predicted metal-dependent hydrolase